MGDQDRALSIPSAAELRALLELHERASTGEWRISSGSFGDSLWVSTWWRERADGDGSICHVPAERTITHREGYGNETRFTKKTIKTARADAELIVAAVNVLPKLITALLGPDQVDETAWLLEFAADKYGPIRYFSIGEPPVISADDATRFARKRDAEAYARIHEVRGARPVEHAWTGIDPAQAIEARAQTPGQSS